MSTYRTQGKDSSNFLCSLSLLVAMSTSTNRDPTAPDDSGRDRGGVLAGDDILPLRELCGDPGREAGERNCGRRGRVRARDRGRERRRIGWPRRPVEIAPYRGLFPSPPLFDRMPTYRTQGKRSLNFLSASRCSRGHGPLSRGSAGPGKDRRNGIAPCPAECMKRAGLYGALGAGEEWLWTGVHGAV